MNTEIRLLSPAAKVTKKTDDVGLKWKMFGNNDQAINGYSSEQIKSCHVDDSFQCIIREYIIN